MTRLTYVYMKQGKSRTSTFYFFLGLKVIGQTLWILLIPILIATILLGVLGFFTKSLSVDMHIVTNNIGFTILSAWRSGQDIALLKSLQTQKIRIWIDSIGLHAKQLLDERNQDLLLKDASVFFRAKDGGWIAFASKSHDLHLLSMYITNGSTVNLSRRREILALHLVPAPHGRAEATLNLPGPEIYVYSYNCEIVDENGEFVSGLAPGPQQRFILRPLKPSVTLVSTSEVEFEVDFPHGDNHSLLGVFSRYLQIKDVTFFPRGDEIPRAIERGSLSFHGHNKDPLDLGSLFVRIPAKNRLDLVSISTTTGYLDLVLSGQVNSLRAGRVPEPKNQVLPSWLEWIYQHNRLGIIIGLLVWLSGVIVAAISFRTSLEGRT